MQNAFRLTVVSVLAAGLFGGCGSETCVSSVSLYADLDLDGYGKGDEIGIGCPEEPGMGQASNADDCDDADPNVNPNAEDICNLVDDDCDGGIDEAHRKTSWYPDIDADGFGGGASTSACEAPGPDWAPEPGDCDDTNPAVNPDAVEICNNGIDDDCNGAADDDDFTVDPDTYLHWFLDGDLDGFGDGSVYIEACQPPTPSHILDGTDCDDDNAAISPAATEVCDEIDNDCDLLIDDADPSIDPSTQLTFYTDDDGDGYGGDLTTLACDSIAGYGVDNSDDCDDADPAVTIPTNWLYDLDGDGFGAGAPLSFGCFPPEPGTVGEVFGVDCDDNDPYVNPAAAEICGDDIDNDCDGTDKSCGPIGSFMVEDGPQWGTDPPVYSCIEVCALLFGGVDTDYHCSTDKVNLDYMAFVSGWGDGQYCTPPGVAEDYSKEQAGNPGYNCGFGACAYSAYVTDWCVAGAGGSATNYCWER